LAISILFAPIMHMAVIYEQHNCYVQI